MGYLVSILWSILHSSCLCQIAFDLQVCVLPNLIGDATQQDLIQNSLHWENETDKTIWALAQSWWTYLAAWALRTMTVIEVVLTTTWQPCLAAPIAHCALDMRWYCPSCIPCCGCIHSDLVICWCWTVPICHDFLVTPETLRFACPLALCMYCHHQWFGIFRLQSSVQSFVIMKFCIKFLTI